MTAATNSVTQIILLEDKSAPVSSAGVSSTVLVVDLSAPVCSAGVSSSSLIVTEQAVGADASYLNQLYHATLFRESGGKTSISSAVHQALIVTEGPPGLGYVDVNNVLQTILVAESNSPTIATQVNHQTLILEPSAPSRATKVGSSVLLITEGPILSGIVTGVANVVITQDLDRGELYANAASQSTLVITEAKSRDPDRLKVLTNSYSYVKPYNHPNDFAENHRIRGLTRGIATVTKFKIPTQVAAMQSVKVLTTSSVVKQEFMDPKDLAAKIQVNTLEHAVVSKTLYPEYVISNVQTPSTSHLIAQRTVQVAPQDIQSDSQSLQISNAIASTSYFPDLIGIRSMTQTQTLRGEVAYSVTAADPSGIRTVKQALQATIASASNVPFVNSALIQSDTTVCNLDIVTAQVTEYEKDVQSTTTVYSNCMQVVMPLEYLSPTDPAFKSQIRLVRLKNETVLATILADPAEMKSTARTRGVKVEHCILSAYTDPTTVKSSTATKGLTHSIAQVSERPNPAGITPSIYNYHLAFYSASNADRYTILPSSSQTLNQIVVEAALSVEMYDPITIHATGRVYTVGILTALESPYPDPTDAKPNRRVSSARVTRK